MQNNFNPWEIFSSGNMGNDMEEVVETCDCKVLRIKDSGGGDGLMTIYRVFDGVYLMYNDFHMEQCYSRFESPERIFCIDHCREGRIEHCTDNNMRYYVESGDLRIDRRVHHSGNVEFPVSHYHGITIGFLLDYAEKSVQKAMPEISVNLAELADKFCSSDNIFILRKNAFIEHIFSELYHVPSKIRMDYFKIKVMELLVFLRALEPSGYQDDCPYFYSGQIEKIKSVHKLLTDNLARSYTTQELARKFGLSTAALKNGFKGVYGSPIYTYIRTYKMNVAASMLVTDRHKKIIDIAACVGYDNPSKFAAAFREIFDMSPSEYRNNRR